ncbi:MAG: DUF262 domain-containing protein [Hyphomicrobium sp.]|jgi:hypothetical protein
MADSPKQIVDDIANVLKQANTTALDLSFNELLDMHQSAELNITPDYQRLFRWTEGQRSRFIESLLLEMPVPPIFVIEEDSGTYLLIDGLQRISSYLHFRGHLAAPHLDPPVVIGESLRLTECDIVSSLNDLTFAELPSALQIRLKRAFIRVEVIRKGTDPRFKYHMFKRLNTGGDQLSEQQVRNCTIRMLDSKFPDFIIQMSELDDFRECTSALTQERRLSAVDQELVLRFFALKNRRARFRHEVSDFLTEYMEDVADPSKAEPFSYADEETTFRRTFSVLRQTLSDRAFAFANAARNNLSGGFSVYHFESIAIGLQAVLGRLPADGQDLNQLDQELRAIKLDPAFIAITKGGGKNSPGQLANRIQFVEDRLRHAFP